MKFAFASMLFVTAALAAGPSFANAADAANPSTPGHAEHFHRGERNPVARTVRRLDDLGKKLHLKSSQQAAWQTYSSEVIAQTRVRRLKWQQMRLARRASHENLSTPERMAKVADRLHQAADQMSQLASETKRLYEQLGPEQKTIFDLYARTEWRAHNSIHGRYR